MYTQCPKCRTIFEIDEAALQAALGIVRCGHCSERFDALRTLSGELPAGPDATLPDHDPEQLTPVLVQAVAPRESRERARHLQATSDALAASPPASAVDIPQAQQTHGATASCMDRATRALVADVIGVPPEAVGGSTAWLATALPRQSWRADAGSVGFHPVVPTVGIATDSPDGEAGVMIDPDPSAPVGASQATAVAGEVTPDAGRAADPERSAAIPWEPNASDGSSAETTSMPDARPPAPLLLLVHEDRDIPPVDAADAPGGDTTAAATHEALPGTGAVPVGMAESTDADAGAVVPLYVPPRRPRVRRVSALFAVGCAVLVLVLAAQIGWARRAALVRDPATRAWALGVCAKIDCRLPPIRDVGRLELLSRDVRADPASAGVLVITATVRNDAAFRQPWPVVAVQLTDLDNNVIAMRRFLPAQYISDAARRHAGIAPGAIAAVAFEVADPGQRASGFRFSLE